MRASKKDCEAEKCLYLPWVTFQVLDFLFHFTEIINSYGFLGVFTL